MTSHRKPAAFRLDDPHVVVAPPPEEGAKTRAQRGAIRVTPEPEAFDLPVPAAPAEPPAGWWRSAAGSPPRR